MTARHYDNPWNLSPQQERIIHLYSIEGTYKAVAERIGISYGTVNCAVQAIHRKMGANTVTRCAVLYALWRQAVLGPSREVEGFLAPAPGSRGGTPATEERGAPAEGLGG